MALTIFGILERLLASIGAPGGLLDEIKTELVKIKTEFPDAETQITKLTALLESTLRPYLDPAQAAAMLAGIARDIISGTTGTDPHAWRLSV